MTSDGHIHQTWAGLHSSERLYRYYGRLQSKLERRNFLSLVLVGISSTGAAAVLLGHLPAYIAAILYFLVAGAVIWVFVSEYSKKAALAALASSQWREISLDWKQLWYDLDDLDSGEILARTETLRNREKVAGAEAQCGPDDDSINKKCAEEAYAVLNAEFPS